MKWPDNRGKIGAMYFLRIVLKSRNIFVQKPWTLFHQLTWKPLLHRDPNFWPQWPVLEKDRWSGVRTYFRLCWVKGISRSQIWRKCSSMQPFSFPSSPHLPTLVGTPYGTHSAASGTKRHLRTLGSSSCAGSASGHTREGAQAAARAGAAVLSPPAALITP